jgi:hypothetical protein
MLSSRLGVDVFGQLFSDSTVESRLCDHPLAGFPVLEQDLEEFDSLFDITIRYLLY